MGSAPSSPRRARGWNRPTDDGAEKQSDADIESEFTRITIDDIPEEYRFCFLTLLLVTLVTT